MFEPVDQLPSAPAPLNPSPISAPAPLSTVLRRPSRSVETTPSGPETVFGDAPTAGLGSIDFADARLTSEVLVEPGSRDVFAPGSAQAESIAIAQQSSPAPAFMRDSQAPAHRPGPLAMAALTMLALVLALGLAAQATHQHRDTLAASYPSFEPLLSSWCASFGCTISAPRNIADVHIESSGLSPAPAPLSTNTGAAASTPDGAASGPGNVTATATSAAGAAEAVAADGAVQLSVTLRNHGATRVALPSLDVTLTDATGKTLSRRALSPADFGVDDPVLATGAEQTLQAVLSLGADRRPTGYSVDVFYP
jgi:hypothetical protein